MIGNEVVHQVLEDPATAPIGAHLRAMLPVLRKVTQGSIEAADMSALLAAGLSRAKIEDALRVGWCFNVITRLADTFAFEVGPQAAFDASAKVLLSRGYRL